jgi:hypothetical protein
MPTAIAVVVRPEGRPGHSGERAKSKHVGATLRLRLLRKLRFARTGNPEFGHRNARLLLRAAA